MVQFLIALKFDINMMVIGELYKCHSVPSILESVLTLTLEVNIYFQHSGQKSI